MDLDHFLDLKPKQGDSDFGGLLDSAAATPAAVDSPSHPRTGHPPASGRSLSPQGESQPAENPPPSVWAVADDLFAEEEEVVPPVGPQSHGNYPGPALLDHREEDLLFGEDEEPRTRPLGLEGGPRSSSPDTTARSEDFSAAQQNAGFVPVRSEDLLPLEVKGVGTRSSTNSPQRRRSLPKEDLVDLTGLALSPDEKPSRRREGFSSEQSAPTKPPPPAQPDFDDDLLDLDSSRRARGEDNLLFDEQEKSPATKKSFSTTAEEPCDPPAPCDLRNSTVRGGAPAQEGPFAGDRTFAAFRRRRQFKPRPDGVALRILLPGNHLSVFAAGITPETQTRHVESALRTWLGWSTASFPANEHRLFVTAACSRGRVNERALHPEERPLRVLAATTSNMQYFLSSAFQNGPYRTSPLHSESGSRDGRPSPSSSASSPASGVDHGGARGYTLHQSSTTDRAGVPADEESSAVARPVSAAHRGAGDGHGGVAHEFLPTPTEDHESTNGGVSVSAAEDGSAGSRVVSSLSALRFVFKDAGSMLGVIGGAAGAGGKSSSSTENKTADRGGEQNLRSPESDIKQNQIRSGFLGKLSQKNAKEFKWREFTLTKSELVYNRPGGGRSRWRLFIIFYNKT